MNKVEHLLACRAKALRAGDRGQARAITADLQRFGYVDAPTVHVPVELAATPVSPEVAREQARAVIARVLAPRPHAGGGGLAVVAHIDALIAHDAVKTPPPAPAAAKRPGRKPLPRCEHKKIVGRCPQCAAAAEA